MGFVERVENGLGLLWGDLSSPQDRKAYVLLVLNSSMVLAEFDRQLVLFLQGEDAFVADGALPVALFAFLLHISPCLCERVRVDVFEPPVRREPVA